jgi:hypothetical protein
VSGFSWEGEESVWIGEDHSEGFEEVGRKGGEGG